MSLTIILNIRKLSGEFRTLLHQCLKLNPVELIVNSNHREVIDYFISHYRKHQLTCFRFSNLKNLTVEVSKTYKSDYYIALDSVDPNLNHEYLTTILNDFKISKASWGHLINPISSEFLYQISSNKPHMDIQESINEINRFVILHNRHAMEENSIRYMLTPYRLDYVPVRSLVNRCVMITGALGGIGSCIAKKYYQKGWSVIGLDLPEKKDVPYDNRRYLNHYYSLDLGRRSLNRKLKKILAKLRRLDGLVHCAALQVNNTLNETSSSDWNRVLNINVKSVWMISKAIFPLLQKTVGWITIINSIHAFCSSKSVGAYAISKSALLGLVRNMAIEWGEHGIRVNAIAPGAIETPMLMDGMGRRGKSPEEELRLLKSRHLMGRIGQPGDIAQAVYYLGKAEFTTGQTIIADGGVSLILSTEV